METLISDLKKVMNSEIEDKDKYMKMLINGFIKERDSELLTIQGVVQQSELLLCSICDKETKHDTTLRNELHCLKCGNVAKE